jgi:hypothetical protein
MEIGDTVLYEGRSYVLRGLDPMSMPARCAHLEDVETGALLAVPLAVLEPEG